MRAFHPTPCVRIWLEFVKPNAEMRTAPVSHQKLPQQSATNAIKGNRKHSEINEAARFTAAHNGLVTGSSPAGPTNKIRGSSSLVLDHRTRDAPLRPRRHALATTRLTLHSVPDPALRSSIVDSASSSHETAGPRPILPRAPKPLNFSNRALPSPAAVVQRSIRQFSSK